MSDSIWKTLSAIDCNKHIEKKGGFSYLSWTWAWAMVKEKYPLARYELLDDHIFSDGTMEVRVSVTITQPELVPLENTMWLPVLDFKNKAIANPNAFDINSARMRCLVKCLAMFGLGHYIYAGESAPQERQDDPSDAIRENVATIAAIKESIASGSYSAGIEAWRELDEETMRKLWVAPTKGGAFTTEERKIMQSTEFKNGETV